MNTDVIPVESIQERDIDLLLLEEFSSDEQFCDWFLSELKLPKFKSKNGAWRSITDHGLGETDILFSYSTESSEVFVLIENKLDANFQTNQSSRYTKRAKNYMLEKQCDVAYTVLAAPSLYCEKQYEFENCISYESIASWFDQKATHRSSFKSQLLRIAIEKLRRGYQPTNSIPVQQFWHSYWVYKQKHHSSLQMKQPGIVPAASSWPMLYDEELGNKIVFYHKFDQGNTDVTFKGFPLEAKTKIQENTPGWAKFVAHSKTFSIRIFSGKITKEASFVSQVESVENGLQNLRKLQNWLRENKNWLQQWL